MLQCTKLCKTYKPKKGVPVVALDNISLTFPDTGMVFLLGKSGSGKSTLLNILGGLDRYDSGDIIVKGTSTKNFNQSHFDSYRNTYIGFIFQEYNVLEEFTVGANIALAIELQGRKASDEEINKILDEVDLKGLGNRKPNELSGGQKQRVAIARALVKNPEIIFADEPTGALDSNTGKAIFDTLKKLSKDHLVIIVSHDREFAEGYADRIIELADGRVIDDVTLSNEEALNEEKALEFDGNTIKIPENYHLTEEDRLKINAYLDGEAKVLESLKKTGSCRGRFKKTDESAIVSENKGGFHLIKSKLPVKNAFKIGCGALKYKKVRLVFTVLLSVVAFILFGLADTFASYNHIRACTDSIADSDVSYASVIKKVVFNGDGYTNYITKKISQEDLDSLYSATGIKMVGVYKPGYDDGDVASFKYNTSGGNSNLCVSEFSGFAEISSEMLEKMGYKLTCGSLPSNENEIAITYFTYNTFKQGGYKYYKDFEEGQQTEINSPEDLLGKELFLGEKILKISGIVDTGFDFERYAKLDTDLNMSSIAKYALTSELEKEVSYSLCNICFVNTLSAIATEKQYGRLSSAIAINIRPSDEKYISCTTNTIATLDKINSDGIVWFNGAKTELAENEILLPAESTFLLKSSGDSSYSGTSISESPEAASWLSSYATISEDSNGTNILSATGLKDIVIVGYFTDTSGNYSMMSRSIIVSDSVYGELSGGIYSFAVGAMPENKDEIEKLAEFCYGESDGTKYPLQNSVTFELDSLNDVFKEISTVFIYVGLAFAVFAAVLLSTFIASSVSYKKQEIGILRAIGSRSNDVFRIFFSESFVIAMINFIITSVGTFITVTAINAGIRSKGLLVTVLHIGVRQIGLILLLSLVVAAVASFLPVKKIASKKPIDAIRMR